MSDVSENPASAQLGEADIALFREIGTSRPVHQGEYLYREGDASYDFFVVVSAEVDIIVRADGADRVVGHHGAGRFLGELNMLTGLRVFVSARVTKAGEVIAVPRERLRDLMTTNARLGDTILAAFIARRALLLENAAPTIRVVGSYRRLDAARYAATDMEARQCRGAPVVIVGGGNSAGQAAIYLAQNAGPVSVVIRSDDLAKSMSQYLVDRIEADPEITVRTNTSVTALDGDESLEVVQLRGAEGDYELECKALFSFIGADPASGWLSGCAALDDRGFVLTDAALTEDLLGETWTGLGRGPLPFETSRPGLFAVGDLRSESVKRVASAVGEGSAAVRAVHQHLAFMS